MTSPHALRTLIEQWRDFSTKPIGVNCAAGYDGITATLGKCADELEALLSAFPETPAADGVRDEDDPCKFCGADGVLSVGGVCLCRHCHRKWMKITDEEARRLTETP